MAWNLHFNTCAKLIEFLKKILYSQDFVNQHKRSPKDFTRNRLLTFQMLFLYFINLPKGSYQDELDHFFKALFKLDVAVAMVSKMALCLARKKLEYSAFVELNQHLSEFFYKHFKSVKTWHGFNLFGIVRIPVNPSTRSGHSVHLFRSIPSMFSGTDRRWLFPMSQTSYF